MTSCFCKCNIDVEIYTRIINLPDGRWITTREFKGDTNYESFDDEFDIYNIEYNNSLEAKSSYDIISVSYFDSYMLVYFNGCDKPIKFNKESLEYNDIDNYVKNHLCNPIKC